MSSSQFHFSHRFQPFCNYVCEDESTPHGSGSCPDPTQFDFAECNQTQTGNGCTLEGCVGWTQGVFPRLVEEHEYQQQIQLIMKQQQIEIQRRRELTTTPNNDDPIWTSKATGKKYRVINGGVPEYANLSLHLTTLETTIDDYIPSSSYDGNLVLDFELWTPLWELNRLSIDSFHARIYQEYSLDRMAHAHPTWNASSVNAAASRAFEQAAETFFVTTLQTLRALRPRARVGFYGYPFGHYGDCVGSKSDTKNKDLANNAGDPENLRCGYNNPITGPMYRAQNQRLAAVFQASSALFPSIYLQPQGLLHNESFGMWRIYNQIYVNDTVYETIRLVDEIVVPVSYMPIPILPFFWAFYHNGSALLLPDDVSMIAKNTYVPPYATAVVQWGSNGERNKIGAWQSAVGGPNMQFAVDSVENCSIGLCSGHGWCTRSTVFPNNYTNTTPPPHSICICDTGYGGFGCEEAVLVK